MHESKSNIAVRVVLNALLLLSVAWFPWWVSLVVVIVLVSRYRAYEVILWGGMIDLLYGSTASVGMPFLSTATFALLLALAEVIKPRLVFYSK